MKYKLGLDLGSTSIGWSVIESDSGIIADVGVRIFDDGRNDKDRMALCVTRREKRGLRRLNKRRKMRINTLISRLVEIKLLPDDESARKALKDLNPYKNSTSDDPQETENIKKSRKMPIYALRAKALNEQLEPNELGRIFLQLAQRRGFRSNRKGDANSESKLAKSNEDLKSQIEKYKARTYGEYLYKKHLEDPSEPIRIKKAYKENKELRDGVLFPFRYNYEKEFDAIWDKQKEFYPDILNDKNKQTIKNVIFFQRPLKEQEIGHCILEPNEERIPKAHPLFQEFRILQAVNNIEIFNPESGKLSEPDEKEKRDALIKILNEKDKKIKIKDLKRRKEFKNIEFINKDDSDSLPVNTTEKYIRKGSLKLQKFWNGLSEENKGKIILLLARPGRYIEAYQKAKTMDEQDNEIVKYLKKEYDLNEEVARELILVNFENGYGNLSKKAIENILPHLRKGRVYSVACKDAGYNHSEFKDAPRDKLPYYGEILREACLGAKNNPQNDMEKFGKISNVTVHIALNQVRLLINELIEKYGKPYDIAIEYARDLPASKKERDKIVKQQKENEQKNEEIRKKLEECEVKPNRYNIDKYKIWESMHTDPLKRECPYTGKLISLEALFSKNSIVDIDHILPLKRTFDDSFNNKVVCFSYVNRTEKGEKTPYEAWGNTKEWKKIYERAKSLNKERMWRFEKDAMERFEEQKSPIARSLNDTRYMTRILQRYLLPIVSEEEKKNIQAVPGVLTAMVRKVWGLNKYKDKKNTDEYRSLHYHHASDAIVIASLTRDQINRINRARKENYQKYKDHKDLLKQEVPRPNKESIEDIKKKISNIKISHKPSLKNIHDENSTIGELHEETAWGVRGFSDKRTSTNFYCKEKGNKENKDFTTYVPIFEKKEDRDAYFDAYKKWFIMKGKSKVQAITKEEKKIREELRKEEENTENSLCEAAKKAFKWHVSGNNFCITIYEINPKHKVRGLAAENRGEWESEVISNYNAAIRRERNENISYLSYKYPSSRKVMELHKNDMIIATFSRKEIEDMKDNDRDEDKEEKISEKEIENKSELKLCEYLKKEMTKHPGDYINILFRLKKISATDKRMYFIPHDIAREKKDDMCWSTSCKGLKEHKAHKVFVSVTGRVLGKTS